MIAYYALVFLLIYTLSMAAYCLFRHPLYAAVATMGLFMSGIFTLQWCSEYFDLQGSPMHWSTGLALLIALQVCVTGLAWQAVRRDWRLTN